MVQILPQFDPMGQIGQGLGQGAGEALKMLGQGKMTRDALQGIRQMDLSQTSPMEVLSMLSEAGQYVPGLQRNLKGVYESLLSERKGQLATQSGQKAAEIAQNRRSGFSPLDDLDQNIAQAEQRAAAGTDSRTGKRGIKRAQEQDVSKLTLSPEEVYQLRAQHDAVGDVAGGDAAVQKAQDQLLQAEQIRIQRAEQQNKEMMQQRDLDQEQANIVQSRVKRLLESKGMSQSPLWDRKALKEFNNLANDPKNDKLTEAELWNKAGLKIERQIEDLVGKQSEVARPTFSLNQKRRAQGTKTWVQEFLKAYGNTKEDRDIIETQLMDNGWSRAEAKLMTQPLNDNVEKVLKSVGPISKFTKDKFFEGGIIGQEGRQSAKREKYIDKLSTDLVKKGDFNQTQSLLGLKYNLVRKLGLSDNDAIDVINRMREHGFKPSEAQISELPFVEQNTVPSLVEIFGKELSALTGGAMGYLFGPESTRKANERLPPLL